MNTLRAGLAGLLGTALAAATALPAHAQLPLTARGLGMGNSYQAAARGYESLFTNPAHLALPGSPGWSVGLPQVAAGATVLGLDVGDLNDLRDYDEIPASRADEILAAIPQGTDFEYDVKLPLAALQVGSLAFGVSYNTVGNHTLDVDIVDLFLNDYQLGETYAAPNTFGSRLTYVDLAVAYGRQVGPVALGVTAHYYLGRDLVRSGIVDVDTLGLPSPDVEVTYTGVRSDKGNGLGVDVGAAMQPIPGLTVSAAVANAFTTFEWDDELVANSIVLTSADIQDTDFAGLRTEYGTNDQSYATYVGGLEAEQRVVVERLAGELFTDADPARTLRLGAAWEPGTGTVVAGSYQANLEDSRFAGAWEKSAGVGVEQRLAFVTLRAGAATDLDDGSLLSAGIGLGPLQLGAGRLSNGSDREGWVFSLGLAARGAPRW